MNKDFGKILRSAYSNAKEFHEVVKRMSDASKTTDRDLKKLECEFLEGPVSTGNVSSSNKVIKRMSKQGVLAAEAGSEMRDLLMKKKITMNKKVFINAPVMNIEQNNIPVFQELQRELWSEELEARAPGLMLKQIDPKNFEAYIKDCTRLMIDCDLIINHGDWHNFKECVRLAEIGRLLGIEVIHHTGFKVWLKNQSQTKSIEVND